MASPRHRAHEAAPQSFFTMIGIIIVSFVVCVISVCVISMAVVSVEFLVKLLSNPVILGVLLVWIDCFGRRCLAGASSVGWRFVSSACWGLALVFWSMACSLGRPHRAIAWTTRVIGQFGTQAAPAGEEASKWARLIGWGSQAVAVAVRAAGSAVGAAVSWAASVRRDGHLIGWGNKAARLHDQQHNVGGLYHDQPDNVQGLHHDQQDNAEGRDHTENVSSPLTDQTENVENLQSDRNESIESPQHEQQENAGSARHEQQENVERPWLRSLL